MGVAAVTVVLVMPAHEQAEAKREEADEVGVQAVCAKAGTLTAMIVVPANDGVIVVMLLPDVMVVVEALG